MERECYVSPNQFLSKRIRASLCSILWSRSLQCTSIKELKQHFPMDQLARTVRIVQQNANVTNYPNKGRGSDLFTILCQYDELLIFLLHYQDLLVLGPFGFDSLKRGAK